MLLIPAESDLCGIHEREAKPVRWSHSGPTARDIPDPLRWLGGLRAEERAGTAWEACVYTSWAEGMGVGVGLDGYRYWNGCRGIWRTYGELGTRPKAGTGNLETWEAGSFGVRLEGPALLPMMQSSGPTPGEESGSKAREESVGRGQISAGQSVFRKKTLGGGVVDHPVANRGSTIDCPGREDSIMTVCISLLD